MNSKKYPALTTALWLCLAALIASALIFPEVFIKRVISFYTWDDYLLDYQSTFALTGFFYQGGVQLWDFFGQLPHTFFWATHGMFRIPNVLTALIYVIFSPLSDHSGEFFDRVFSIVYPGSLLVIRTIGIYLLLKRISDDQWAVRIATVIFAVLFCPAAFMIGTFYQSFYPLIMYLILSFFLTLRPMYLGMTILFFILSLSQGMAHTFYMYLGINFFVISCLVYSFCVHRSRFSNWKVALKRNSSELRTGVLWLLLAAVVILGPYIYMDLTCLKDVACDMAHSRLSGMWNPGHYFHQLMLDQTPPADFFRRMLDFTFLPGRSFFLGYMIFFLSGVAITLSDDRRKWIFVTSIILVWMINFPKDSFSIGLIGHWINVLTNPFKVMVRSYQMASNAIINFLLMPLAVMGWGALKSIRNGVIPQHWRLRSFAVFMVVFAISSWGFQPTATRIYFVVMTVLALTAFSFITVTPKRADLRRVAMLIFVAMIVNDMLLSAWQMKHFLSTYCRMRPHTIGALPAQTGLVGMDFQNPKIMPFTAATDNYPDVDNYYLWILPDISLNYDRIINRQLMLTPIDSHRPRHAAFGDWVNDPWMKEYVKENNHLFSFAPYALRESPRTFASIVERGIADRVITVEGNAPGLRSEIPANPANIGTGADQWVSIAADVGEGDPGWVYEDRMSIWQFPLQGSIPDYFATNVLSHDHWVRFFIRSGDQKYIELTPVQGQLLRPFSFDVQNIKEGKVLVALPNDIPYKGLHGVLLLKARDASGITGVWKHQSDATGINFQAPADGWMVVQFPYDPKWQVEVDGRQTKFYKADHSFIGFPITKGDHKILVEYWPHSWLRWGMPVSVVSATALFIILLILALIK